MLKRMICCLVLCCAMLGARAEFALVIDGVSMVPVKSTVDCVRSFDHNPTVQYIAKTKQVIVKDEKTTLIMTIGSTAATLNGKPLALPKPPYLLYGGPYAPLATLGSALGWKVNKTADGFIAVEYADQGNWVFSGDPIQPYALVPLPMTTQALALRQKVIPQAQAQAIFNAIVADNKASVAKLLKANPALIYARTTNNDMPIHMAVRVGNKAMVSLLLANGASIKDRGNNGNTPLHTAAAGGMISGTFGGDEDKEKGLASIEMYLSPTDAQLADVAAFLLAKGADLNAWNAKGQTPLYLALWPSPDEHQAVAKLLLAKGANLNARDTEGNTPLHEAAGHGNMPAIDLLLAKGARLEARNNEGKTPLYTVLEFLLHEDMAEYLVKKGGDINTKDNQGMTVLANKVQIQGSTVIDDVKKILDLRADVNAVDAKGNTVLHLAIHSFNPEMIKLLIARGANVEAKNKEGQTAYQLAKEMDMKEVMNAFPQPK